MHVVIRCPLRSRPGDRCLLRSGTYHVTDNPASIGDLRGTAAQPIVIGAAGDGPVLLDGTASVAGAGWVAAPEAGPGVRKLHMSAEAGGVYQLFAQKIGVAATALGTDRYDMQVPMSPVVRTTCLIEHRLPP